MISALKLEIAKLRRAQYGKSSERRARLIDQLELQLEELQAAPPRTTPELPKHPGIPRCFLR